MKYEPGLCNFPFFLSEQVPDLHKLKCKLTAYRNMHSIAYTSVSVD